MAEPTIQLGGGNWAGKTDNLLGYYKEGERFYKQDFTFSRSTTGTYTDSDGYIQEMPYNKLLQSNTFDTSWSTTNASVTGSQSGYDGTNNAWLLNESAVGGRVLQSISGSGVMTMSLYAKSGTLDFILVYINTTGTDPFAYFDLTNGDVSTSGASSRINASAVAVGDGWYRLTVTGNIGTLSSIEIYPANSLSSHTESAGSIFIQNAQLVKGSSAKTYFPTTTRLNMPRVDYLNNSNGSLILEPQRTNLITYSEDFTNSGWDDSWYPVSITSNSIISPDGSLNATLITPTSGNSKHAIRNLSASAVSGNTYTLSVFVKKGASRYVVFGDAGDALWRVVTADLDNGVITNEYNSIGTITDYENGWYRITCQITRSNSGTIQFSLGASETNSNSALPDFDDTSLTIYAFGAQIEQGSYATTLINTSGSSVTRNKDVCELTNVADRINSTEGTIYGEQKSLETNFTYNYFASVSDGTNNNRLEIRQSSTGLQFLWRVGGTYQNQITKLNAPFTSFIKYALRYSSTDIKFYVNGSLVGTINSPTLYASGVLNNIEFADGSGNDNFRGTVKELKYYNTALSDSELATLTTL